MRVLHIYGGNLYGGVERLLVTMAQQRAAAPAVEARFALCFRGRLWQELEAAGGYSTPDLGRSLRSLSAVASLPGSERPLGSGRLRAAAGGDLPCVVELCHLRAGVPGGGIESGVVDA